MAIIIASAAIFGEKEVNSKNPAFGKYISAYTSGIVSKTSSIKIRLTSEIAEKIQNKDEAPVDIFDFTPNIKGTTYWFDDNTIEFKPDKYLDSDEEFYVKFNLKKVTEVPKNLKFFSFKFKTIEQSFEISLEEQKTIDKSSLKWQKAIGVVKTADAEITENVKKMLSATQNDENLKIKWKSEDDGKEHYFEIDSIKREKKASHVKMDWNGKSIGVKKTGKMEIEIPSIDDFKFISAKVVHYPEQYLQIQFSDPLKQNQNLNGLITIQNSKNIRYIIDDNVVRVYSSSYLKGTKSVSINQGIKNVLNFKMQKTKKFSMAFEAIKPKIRLVNKGVILPSSKDGLVLPFEAVNLKAVDIRIIKIYEKNIIQFLQVNNLKGDYQLKRVGKPVLQKTVRLDKSKVVDFGVWNKFSLDLNKLIKAEPGAIYRVSIGFRKKHSLYSCTNNSDDDEGEEELSESWSNPEEEESSFWDNYDNYYFGNYSWRERDNPCSQAFFGSRRTVSQNIIASNIGMIVKKGNDGVIKVFATDMRTTAPLKNTVIEIFDYQNQLLKSKKTDNEGKVTFDKLKDPYFVVAKSGKERSYLKITNGESLSLSRFDVSGVSVKKGLKGFIYGERGVWRPGDSLYLAFILREESEALPDNHPIVFELRNPQNQIVKRVIKQKSNSRFYTYKIKTKDDSPTGNWEAKVQIGGVKFYKTIKIETIKPNRLKINIKFKEEYIEANKSAVANLDVKWLHGAVAKDLKAKVEVIMSPVKTTFPKFSDFTFDDPTKSFKTESNTIFDGSVDEKGLAEFNANISTDISAPGKLKAIFVTKVFENGGNFSIDQFSLPFYPYNSFTGIKLPKGDKTRGMLLTDKTHPVEVAIVNPDGKYAKGSHKLEMQFYKLNWRWWWDKSQESLTNFTYRSSVKKLKKEIIYSKNGKAKWNLDVKYPNWGRYLVRVKNLTTGHSTAKVVYIDWPGWAGRAQKDGVGGAAMLSFTTNKSKYSVGDKVELNIPSSDKGRALISVENGTKVINTYWVETSKGQTKFSFKATKEMTPNIFVNVTLLQAHSQTANDLPIRLYGIVPLTIENPKTHLQPVISMPDVLESEKIVTIKVSEKNKKKMTYTLAIVDEGLLDLTRYKTPNPWNSFFAKEAIGVKTWDIYDMVIGAYGGKLERLLSIGGDGEEEGQGGKKANRFKPVVKYLGPFEYNGGVNTHRVKIPRYIGSVKTMVIAGSDDAYGMAEKATPVVKPLMLLASLPRVLGPGEKVKLPVNIFAMEKNIKNVKIQVKTNNIIKVLGGNSKTVRFSETGDKYVNFDLEVAEALGIGKVEIIASSGSNKAVYEIELDIRNPNPKVTSVIADVVSKGDTWKSDFKPVGISGTNTAVLEVSSIPPINLDKRLKYLIKYPHGCVEQTTSSIFPQLYLTDLTDLPKEQKDKIEKNIKDGIKRIVSFQLFNGGLGYWPNSSNVSEWGTNYAGHFMVEAKKRGYSVPRSFMKKWRKYQSKKAKNWIDDGNRSQLTQAYRLYSLALEGSPEKGAMNRLRGKSKLKNDAKWRLAAAYHIAGKSNSAKKLISGLSYDIPFYTEMSYTFGSSLRDKAMMLETLVLLGKDTDAFNIVKEISTELSKNKWMSTQTTAYALIAISQFVKKNKSSSGIKFSYAINGSKMANINMNKTIAQINIPISSINEQKITVKNSSGGIIYARLIMEGIPAVGDVRDVENSLNMTVTYKLTNGTIIKPERLEQGTDFVAEIKIRNPGLKGNYKEMALTQIFPSGWEIINTRLLNIGSLGYSSSPTYQDIRDDRVYTYFNIKRSKQKTYRVLLNATFEGRFYLPPAYCEAMYDNTINARKGGKWVEVVKAGL